MTMFMEVANRRVGSGGPGLLRLWNGRPIPE